MYNKNRSCGTRSDSQLFIRRAVSFPFQMFLWGTGGVTRRRAAERIASSPSPLAAASPAQPNPLSVPLSLLPRGWTASSNLPPLRESLKVFVNVCTQASVPSAGALGARWQPRTRGLARVFAGSACSERQALQHPARRRRAGPDREPSGALSLPAPHPQRRESSSPFPGREVTEDFRYY